MVAFPRCKGLLSRALLAGLLSACTGELVLPGEEPEAPAPAGIRMFDGDAQRGDVGEPLPAPIIVLVTDAEGAPIAGATVEFELISAGEGAEVEPSSRLTDGNGLAQAQVVLGNKPGVQTGEARVVAEAGSTLRTSFTAIARTEDRHNRPPDADYNWHCEGLSCEFADASSDDDGSVVAWLWQFGDGEMSEQAEPVHLYPAPGTYLVTLTVTDDDGSTDESTAHVDVGDSD